MLWDPIRYDETCPSSDGACAVVIGNEEIAEARLAQGHPVAWIHATALRTEPLQFSGRDQVSPQAGRDAAAALWKAAGITSPIDEIDVAEIYVPFSWFEPMWLENLGFAPEGEGWKLTEAGETAIGGRLPVNPSGGVLSSNPIGASGLIRFAEAAIQVMGKGGDHQVPGARKALGHAYGGGSQYYSMWVVGADKPEKSRTTIEQTEHPAHEAGRRSREAVIARDKEAWLAVFADDAIVEDPIGPSAFDPEGKGHRGRDAISAFWDMAIAPTTKIEFIFRDTYQCGNEEANVGHILITTGDYQVTAEGVFTYKANDEGKLVALRAYWEMDRAAASRAGRSADWHAEAERRLNRLQSGHMPLSQVA